MPAGIALPRNSVAFLSSRDSFTNSVTKQAFLIPCVERKGQLFTRGNHEQVGRSALVKTYHGELRER